MLVLMMNSERAFSYVNKHKSLVQDPEFEMRWGASESGMSRAVKSGESIKLLHTVGLEFPQVSMASRCAAEVPRQKVSEVGCKTSFRFPLCRRGNCTLPAGINSSKIAGCGRSSRG